MHYNSLKLILIIALLTMLSVSETDAKNVVFSRAHGFVSNNFTLTMSVNEGQLEDGECIRYTTNGDVPTPSSTKYNGKFMISGSKVVRAAIFNGEERVSDVTTATYLMTNSILNQSNTPAGYPTQWGPYATIKGTAPADYEMDPEMTGDANLKDKIVKGLTAIPTLSIVTNKGNFFNQELDEETGGIYIYTGAPAGNGEGRDWERPISMELFGGAENFDVTVDCGVKIHGGHGRLPEKNPKHSLRIVFKSKYGPGKLKYQIFGEKGPKKFDKLVLRCGFGNAWQHWDNGNRKRAQYERDMWARNTQQLMGNPCARGQYVHVYINGMYWGLYNIAERVDDYYCQSNFGGSAEDYDVIKVEEYDGAYIDASAGTLDKWNEMVATSREAATDMARYRDLIGVDKNGKRDESKEVLLDVDNFIDYMLINYYGGNTDWDHHNWLAFRNRVKGNTGFRFICWDSELIFANATDNVTNTYNRKSPTEIFENLMNSQAFRHRFIDRTYKHLVQEGGILTPTRVEEVWDSLYNIIQYPLYDEAARWGDYRRDVHPYNSQGELYTVDGRYMKERNRIKTEYFPARTDNVIQTFTSKGWYSSISAPKVYINGVVNEAADTISINDRITLKTSGTTYYTIDGTEPVTWYSSAKGNINTWASKSAGGNVIANYNKENGENVIIHAITKGSDDWSPMIERKFVIREIATDIADITLSGDSMPQHGIYTTSGIRLADDAILTPGLYIIDGRKVMIK